jgi:hypothetical protein
MNKEGKDVYSTLEKKKKHSFLSVYNCEFLLCCKLNESHDGWALSVSFLVLLYEYL